MQIIISECEKNSDILKINIMPGQNRRSSRLKRGRVNSIVEVDHKKSRVLLGAVQNSNLLASSDNSTAVKIDRNLVNSLVKKNNSAIPSKHNFYRKFA